MERSTEEHRERFLDCPDSFLAAMLLTLSTDLPGNQPKTGGEMIPPVYIGVRAVSRTGQHIPGGHALAGPPSTNYPGPSE